MNMTHKEFFIWLRQQQADKALSQSMVNGANELLAFIEPEKLQAMLMKVNAWNDDVYMNLSKAGAELVNRFEGFRSKPYYDQAGVATIGFGSTYYENAKPVSISDPAISRERALEIKRHTVSVDFAPAINMMFDEEIDSGQITQNMFDALVSLSYNIGIKGLQGSNVYKHIKAGKFIQAADAFLPWNKVRNPRTRALEFNEGLHSRRKQEKALFLA